MNREDFHVSVIITSYNQRQYLMEAIESVVHQTVSPYEIIIADDYSRDGSIELIQDYVTHYPDLIKTIFQKKNLGIPKNRNAALCQVTGNYVAILDGDDRFLPNKLEREFKAVNEYPTAGCVCSNVRFINAEGRPMHVRDQEEQPSGNIFAYVARGKFGLLRGMLMDYALLQKVGFLHEELPSYDGFELTVRLAKYSQFIYISEPLVDYRVHDTSYQKGMKAKDHLRDLQMIYKRMLPWLTDLPVVEKKRIVREWHERLLRFRLRQATDQGSKVGSYLAVLSALAKGGIGWKNLRRTVRAETTRLWPLS